MNRISSFARLSLLAILATPAASHGETFPVEIRVDAGQSWGELHPIWRFFGADEPNYATMPHGSKLIGELGEMKPKEVYFRAHSLLCTGDGTPALKWGSTNAYTEDADGKPKYDWTILDKIFDTYIERGVRPYVQIGFMPKALSTEPEPYQHQWDPTKPYGDIYTGWAHPPKDYEKWAELVYQWVKHSIDRYGKEEVESWYWETWNEANIAYWQGSRDEFFKLHDYAIDAVRRALPTARVGGPDSAGDGGDWSRAFLEHCLRGKNYATGEVGTPLDFFSFHAKGAPDRVDGHVRMGIANQLRTIEAGFRMVASFPELKARNIPIVIGECDPEGCAACQGPQLAYRNGTMYSSYTAASYARIHDLASLYGVNIEGALTWAFEFEGHPMFAGFRSMATGGINKPVLNTFRMMSKMSGNRVATHSDHALSLDQITRRGVRRDADVSALASLDGNKLCVMVWHYHDEDVAGDDAAVTLNLSGLPEGPRDAKVLHYRIDETHSNAYSVWQKMGSPKELSPEQYAELDKVDGLEMLNNGEVLHIDGGEGTLTFNLPRKGVSLIQFVW